MQVIKQGAGSANDHNNQHIMVSEHKKVLLYG